MRESNGDEYYGQYYGKFSEIIFKKAMTGKIEKLIGINCKGIFIKDEKMFCHRH